MFGMKTYLTAAALSVALSAAVAGTASATTPAQVGAVQEATPQTMSSGVKTDVNLSWVTSWARTKCGPNARINPGYGYTPYITTTSGASMRATIYVAACSWGNDSRWGVYSDVFAVHDYASGVTISQNGSLTVTAQDLNWKSFRVPFKTSVDNRLLYTDFVQFTLTKP